jgi:hypothetical protein
MANSKAPKARWLTAAPCIILVTRRFSQKNSSGSLAIFAAIRRASSRVTAALAKTGLSSHILPCGLPYTGIKCLPDTQKRATQSQCLCGFLASGFGRVFCIGAKYDGFNAGSPIDDGPFL